MIIRFSDVDKAPILAIKVPMSTPETLLLPPFRSWLSSIAVNTVDPTYPEAVWNWCTSSINTLLSRLKVANLQHLFVPVVYSSDAFVLDIHPKSKDTVYVFCKNSETGALMYLSLSEFLVQLKG